MLVVPVFATTCPRTGGFCIRYFSVPLVPATGSARSSTPSSAGWPAIAWRIPTSAPVVSRSFAERPEPSTIRTPLVGMPASSRAVMTTCAPAALLPRSERVSDRSLSNCSAVKLSLCRSMLAMMLASGAERVFAMGGASGGVTRTATLPATATPAARRASRKRSAAAFAGRRAV